MSISERMEEHQDDIARISQNVQDLMAKTTSGASLMEASANMAMSDQMQNLMRAIDNPEASERDKFLMGKYMGEMLQEDQENGLINYADYLESVANDPAYADRKDYFKTIATAALQLNDSEAFKIYVQQYAAFETDTSKEAEDTRRAMEEMSQKMREWVDEDELE